MRERDKGKEGDKSSKSINNAKTNDRKFLTSGTRAIYFSASIEDRNMCFLPIMCHARCFFFLSFKRFEIENLCWKNTEKKHIFSAKLNID